VVNGVAPLQVNFTDETMGGNVTGWSWDFDNDGVEDANEQNPSFTYDSGGDYSVALTVTNETGNNFTAVKEDYIHVGTVGIGELTEKSFNCYPNPAKSVINVESAYDLNSIIIFNITGQIVYSDYDNSSKLQTIDISSFEKGVFFMELSTEIETKIIKVVVQ